ncbi:MAG TPA: hypothetical protein VFJ95_07995 [Gammaproteobacteria bacterium]|nr:hypothetical protein [Gammaproteobacteria bacterium]
MLCELGAAADANSAGEIDVALRAGFAAGQIVFTGVGKTRAELVLLVHLAVFEDGVALNHRHAALRELVRRVLLEGAALGRGIEQRHHGHVLERCALVGRIPPARLDHRLRRARRQCQDACGERDRCRFRGHVVDRANTVPRAPPHGLAARGLGVPTISRAFQILRRVERRTDGGSRKRAHRVRWHGACFNWACGRER